MTLTITKRTGTRSPTNRGGSPTHSGQKNMSSEDFGKDQKKYLDILDQELSPVYIQGILLKIFGDFKDAVAKIRDSFLISEPNKRKRVNDSMSISYISEQNVPLERRPSKAEFWLWHNWKEELSK